MSAITEGMRVSRQQLAGQTLIEFALVALPFLLLTFGIIEGGRLLFTYHEVNNAAREGVRYMVAHGALHPDPDEQLGPGDEDAVIEYVLDHTAGLDPADLTVSPVWNDNGNAPGQVVSIQVSYQFEPVIGMIFGLDPIELEAMSEMRIHY